MKDFKVIKKCLKSTLIGNKRQKKLIVNWINNQCAEHSRMLILGTRLLWLHLLRLLESDQPLPAINQSYMANVFRHVSQRSNNGGTQPKNDNAALTETVNTLDWLDRQTLPKQDHRISAYLAKQYVENLETHCKHNQVNYTFKYLKYKLKQLMYEDDIPVKEFSKEIKRSCWKIIYEKCWSKEFDFNPPNRMIDVIEDVAEIFGQFYDGFTDRHKSGRLKTSEAIRYIYSLIEKSNEQIKVKLIPQSSFTIKSITIDSIILKSIQTFKKKMANKRRVKKKKQKQSNQDKHALFSSFFKYKVPPGYKLQFI